MATLHAYDALARPTELQYWDATRADNGYNFFGVSGTSYLLDMEGRVVHTWPIGNNPHLLNDGSILDATTNDPSGFGGFKEVNWDGTTVWTYTESRSTYHPHHDFLRMFNPKLGAYTTLYIANKDLTYDQLIAAGADPSRAPSTGVQMDALVEVYYNSVTKTNTIVWEWCFFDHLIQDYSAAKSNYVGAGKTITSYPNKLNINLAGHNLKADWLHCNSLDYNQALDQIVVNSVQGEFYVIDHGNTFIAGNPTANIALAATSAGDFLYRFGDPARYDQGDKPSILEDWTQSTTGTKQMGGAHGIQWIAEGLTGAGHFLIFNNAEYLSEHTSQSYVMEINPYLDASGNNTGSYVNPPDAGYNTVMPLAVTDKAPKLISKQVVWNYSSASNLTVFSQIGCSAQRLSNGNTLVCADTEGYILEVTPEGAAIWDYIVPVTTDGKVLTLGDRLPMVNSIFRAYRYKADHPALAVRTLTGGSTIAGRTAVDHPYAGTTNYQAMQRQTETQYWDATKAANGYTFFGTQGTAYLIDMQGRVAHTWATGTDPRLLESGNVLDWATDASGNTGLKEIDWNGSTIWQYYETRSGYHPHGDFKLIYDPKLGAYATLYLANKDVTHAQCLAAGCDPADAQYVGAQIETIVEVDMSGNIIWEWSFWDHAIPSVDATKLNYVATGKTIADYPGKIHLNLPGRPLQSNWLDCNSLDFNQSLNQIVVNSRQGEFYVIDHGNTFLTGNPSGSIALAATTAGDFLYRFGDPARYSQGTAPSVGINWETATSGNKQIGGSSNAQWIASGLSGAGHLLVFSNNQYLYQRTPQSYVFEINPYLNSSKVDTGTYVNPPTAGYDTWTFDKDTMKANQSLSKQVTWNYSSVGNHTLFSHFGSSALRLSNGNTLVCATTTGYLVEVDADGNVAWEYIKPVTASGIVPAIGDTLPMTNAVPRATRYAASFAGFSGHTLTSGATITGNTAPVIANTARTPVAPAATDAVWVTSTITDGGSVAGATLTYLTGSGTPTTTTVFTETMTATAVPKPWAGTGAVNTWTVTGGYFEQRTQANYGTGNACGLEYKGQTTNNTLTGAMIATTNSINAAGTSGYVEFWIQTLTLDGTDGWTFQLDSGSGYVTRLSELTGSSHTWQKYTYTLESSERVGTLKMRFQFTAHQS
ncbi:MAG: aryl-sulfate sulfotransferase [Verrucomicrobia bacterium]|nr:aryl-sulfate sulfotransferase [Verrucomicrobiota bacterium]